MQIKKHSNLLLVYLYIALTVSILASFIGPLVLEKTPASVWVGTAIATVGATFLAAIPAYIVAGGLVGIVRMPRAIHKLAVFSSYLLAGTPSIIIGIVGFLVFSNYLGFGWSILSAMLTLVLLLFPTLTTAFIQMLTPMHSRYFESARSYGIGRSEFLLKMIPSMKFASVIEVLTFGWARSLGDTAAVMLTCGAVLEMPGSLFDSVRLLNYHIYLLAMEEPGGMLEAKSLSFIVIIMLLVLLFVPRYIFSLWTKRNSVLCQSAA